MFVDMQYKKLVRLVKIDKSTHTSKRLNLKRDFMHWWCQVYKMRVAVILALLVIGFLCCIPETHGQPVPEEDDGDVVGCSPILPQNFRFCPE